MVLKYLHVIDLSRSDQILSFVCNKPRLLCRRFNEMHNHKPYRHVIYIVTMFQARYTDRDTYLREEVEEEEESSRLAFPTLRVRDV